MRNRHQNWILNGVKTSGTPKNLGRNNIALVLEKLGKPAEVLHPDTIGNINPDREQLRIYRGSTSVNSILKTDPISKLEFRGIVWPTTYTPQTATMGFDGVNTNRTISFSGNKKQSITIDIMGDSLAPAGVPGGRLQVVHSFVSPTAASGECGDDCAPTNCRPAIESGLMSLLATPVGSGYQLGDFLTAKPIFSCTPALSAPTTANVVYHTLTKCDSGSAQDLAEVQNSVAEGIVERVSRDGSMSTYKVLIKNSANAPTTFTSKKGSFLKGCDACPAGYTASASGYYYRVTLEDAGADNSSQVQAMAGAVASSAKKIGENGDIGTYIVVLSNELTAAERATFLTARPTATIDYDFYSATSICVQDTASTATWAAGETCTTTTFEYSIILKDTDCEASRLTELQAAYPDYTVAANASYPAAHCRRGYKITVDSSVVCADCNTDSYIPNAPHDYMGEKWFLTSATAVEGEDCLCGIEFAPKASSFFPPICLADGIGTIKPELTLLVSKTESSEGGLYSSDMSTESIPVSYTEGSTATQFGVDFMQSIDRQNYKDHNGVVGATQADRFVLGQEFELESGKQYPVAQLYVVYKDKNSGVSNVEDNHELISVVLADSSPETIALLQKFNYK